MEWPEQQSCLSVQITTLLVTLAGANGPRLMWNQDLVLGTAIKLRESPSFSIHQFIQTKGEYSLQDTADAYNDPSLCPVLFTQSCWEEDSTERSENSLSHTLALLILSPPHEILAATEGKEGTQAFASIWEFPDVFFHFASGPAQETQLVLCMDFIGHVRREKKPR